MRLIWDKTMTKLTPQRPMTGGTLDGLRPKNYSYWRVGKGNTEGLPLAFSIELAGEYHCEPPHNYGIFDYEVDRWMRVFYTYQGKARWETAEKTVHINEGDLLIIPPNQQGYYNSDESHRFHFFALVGNWPAIWGDGPRLVHIPVGFNRELAGEFVSLRELLILGQTGYSLQAISRFYSIFGRIHTLTNSSETPSLYPDTVRNALIYLEENCTVVFDSAETAAHVHISPSHLRALFEKWVGESPKRYHTRCRINRAKQLLAQKGLSIQTVSEEVGFSDLGYFSRVFKQFTGVSPSQFSKQI